MAGSRRNWIGGRLFVAVLAALTGLTALTAGSAPPAGASPGPSTTTPPNAPLRSQVEYASPEQLALLDRVDAARNGLTNATLKLAAADNLVATRQAELLMAQQRLQQLQVQLGEATSRLEVANDRIIQTKDDVRRRALASYIGDPGVRMANLSLQVAGNGDLGVTLGYLQVVVDTQSRDLRRLDDYRSQADAARRSARTTRALIATELANVATRRVAANGAQAEQDNIRRQALSATRQAALVSGELAGRKSEFAAQIATLERASAAIAQLLRSFDAGRTGPVPVARGLFIVPTPDVPITSPFGPRLDPILGIYKLHSGIDLGAAEGTPILAAADGTVVTATVVDGYGNCTVINHGNGLGTLYGHQSLLLVVTGQQVKRGDVIGLVGHTGYSTGPHLHFEVRVDGTPVDPVPYL